MMATVFDVAKEAGVSIATVSRVMNNSPRVSAATAEAVRAAVEKLGYVPNQQARNLRKSESNAILVMIPDVTKLSYARTLAGINEKAQEYGYTLLMNNAVGEEQELVLNRMAESQRCAGAILLNVMLDDCWLPEVDSKLPLVLCSEYVRGCEVPSVSVDDRQIGREAADCLLELGHRRIGYIGSTVNCSSAVERKEGFAEKLREAGIEADIRLVDYMDVSSNYREGRRVAREILDSPDHPSAIFCYGDILAMAAVTVAGELGIRVPEQLSVLGVDNNVYAEMVHPYVTSFSQPFEEMGRRAMELLHLKMTGQNVPGQREIAVHELKLQESTGPA